jgi:hypothetical protein
MSLPLRAVAVTVSIAAISATLACTPKSDKPAADSAAPSSSASASASASTSGPAPSDLGPVEPIPPGTDVAAVIERGIKAPPYSGNADIHTELAEKAALTMTGRVNLNTALSGTMRLTLTPGAPTEQVIDQVITGTHVYLKQGAGAWTKRTHAEMGAGQLPNLSLSQYAQALVKQGAAAVNGMETKDGVQTYRLSGKVTLDQVKAIEQRLYDQLRIQGLDGFQCAVWVDQQGRVVRMEQWLKISGKDGHNTFTLSGFGPTFVPKPPAGV